MRRGVSISDTRGAYGEISSGEIFVGTNGDFRTGKRSGPSAQSSMRGGGGCNSEWSGLLSRGGTRARWRRSANEIGPGAARVDICLRLRTLVAKNLSGDFVRPNSTHAPGSVFLWHRTRRPEIYFAEHASLARFHRPAGCVCASRHRESW